jgi:hypothetical protein
VVCDNSGRWKINTDELVAVRNGLICCSMRVVGFYHRGMGEAAVRSDIFPLVDGGLIGGRRWSQVEQRRAILRNLFGVPPTYGRAGEGATMKFGIFL